MGIFYAYVTGPSEDPSSKHIVAFVSQDLSDKWWRTLQAQSVAQKNTVPGDQWNVLRVSAQSYVIDGPAAWSFHEQNLLSPSKGFIVRHMHTGAPEAPRIIPPPARTDYRSGKAYSIRLSGHPDFFWNIEKTTTATDHICASKTRVGSTKFLIERTKAKPGEDILIGSDDVKITAIVSGKKSNTIALDGAYLRSNKSAFEFKFEAFFKGGFGVADGDKKIVWSSGFGDRWELVE